MVERNICHVLVITENYRSCLKVKLLGGNRKVRCRTKNIGVRKSLDWEERGTNRTIYLVED